MARLGNAAHDELEVTALLDLADRYDNEYGAYLRGLQGTRGM
ncbi:MAG: hypothetical protein ACI9U6_000074 [Loktanella salsilacus]|jgi:hypothetical protein